MNSLELAYEASTQGRQALGPFPDAKAAKMVIKLLRRYFGIRDDRDKLPFGCVESEEYSKRVKAVVSILDGDANLLIKNLHGGNGPTQREIFRYEAAARSRDMIAASPTNLGATNHSFAILPRV